MADLSAIPLTRIDGASDSLAAHEGKVLLVVNVASKCGLTPQYEGLEALYKQYQDQGFEVLGFPANDFGAQEPGTAEEIMEFCSINYGVSFPLFTKAPVTGEAKQPLYAALTEAMPEKQGDTQTMKERFRGFGMTPNEDPEVLWNFEKFLISRDGSVAGRFAPGTTPSDPLLVGAIETELAK
ncbi:glutathione peroxidase [Novosphingobium sp. CF614]|uniref:glutathione peroxidase n=1 Tax=Novosphingobium sp. CF614 TaxID=1884364 RepID=UPI0008E0B538|nr:glutathione peroxidase [Novosphingobium sp. CF614]SFG22178.1 glutathione peroxidase [Novosphingobium sp. CF614]